ncbi:MAG: hypothetical protein RLZZ282_1542 [Verrucomicrobiota bacterium]|jgi:two-component system sensor histidine kinase UhpB
MHPPRLMIVEDEAIVATHLKINLSQLGYHVVGSAASGEGALTKAADLQPDLVLMDIGLQGQMDGIETAHAMRTRFQIPVVFLTAHSENTMLQRAKLAEPYGYIIKPFRDRDLEITIEIALYKHQLERKLLESEERHRTIIETAMDGFWLADTQGNLLEVNETYCLMVGYNRQELLSLRIPDLEVAQSATDIASQIQRIIDHGRIRFESHHRRKNGSVFDVEISAQYRPTQGGRLMIFLRDITARKQAENSLVQSAKNLHTLTARLQSVREEERATLSRELHDSLGQHLTALQIGLMWIDRHLQSVTPPNLAELSDRIVAMVPIVERLTEQTQTICTSLRSAVLDDLGLVAAIEWEAEETAKRTDLKFLLTLPDDLDLDAPFALALFRIVQEALTNVIRHARATEVTIALMTHPDGLELTIHDNGCGCPPDRLTGSKALGLLGMRERVSTFGGTVEWLNNPGHGITVRVLAPCLTTPPPETP